MLVRLYHTKFGESSGFDACRTTRQVTCNVWKKEVSSKEGDGGDYKDYVSRCEEQCSGGQGKGREHSGRWARRGPPGGIGDPLLNPLDATSELGKWSPVVRSRDHCAA